MKFIPVFLMAFFVFVPATLTVRFLYHELPDPNWNEYFQEYFYSVENYLNYLPAIILIGFSAITINLIYCYNQQLGKTQGELVKEKNKVQKKRLFASDEFGELFLETDEIKWIERIERKTIATTSEKECRLKETITQLEDKLNPNQFTRINRSTIVNLNEVDNYSFWENDKYVLRMKGNKEFVMSRERLNKVKDRLIVTTG